MIAPISPMNRSRPRPLRITSEPIAHAPGTLYTQPDTNTPMTRKLQALDMESPVSPTRGPIPIPVRSNAVKHLITSSGLPSPPNTPPTRSLSKHGFLPLTQPLPVPSTVSPFDFDLEQGQLIGSGLWSKVYSIRIARPGVVSPTTTMLTPPSTPQKFRAPTIPLAYAVKVAKRRDAIQVFEDEARILTHLQRHSHDAHQYIIPFYGFGMSHTALVFEAATSGDLEGLIIRTSTSLDTILTLFPALAKQLVSGLAFMHSAGIVHADIKPANILLDMTTTSPPQLIARYCDFSASFITSDTIPKGATGGGTWTYMAPEQLSSSPLISTPTPASDIWSLGLTLLSFLLSSSPYAEVESNLFMLREAVKMGEPVAFAERGGLGAERLEALRRCEQGREVLRWVEGALVKRREGRWEAREWVGVVGAEGE